jgi:hypothetical protein
MIMALELLADETLESFLHHAEEYHAAEAALRLEQAPDMAERHEQSPLLRETRIDRNAGMLYGVRVMGIKSAHGYDYSLDAQRAACPRYEQMPVGLDHNYNGGPMTVEAAWGTLCNPRVDDRGTVADLRYLKTHVRTEQVLEDAERDVGLFSLSAVTTRVVEHPKGTVKSFSPLRVDLVVRGATTKKLFEQDHLDAEAKAQLAELASVKKEIAEIKARQTVYEQTVEAKAAVAAAVAETTAGIDLKKFWNP